jgi:hypothetical protein
MVHVVDHVLKLIHRLERYSIFLLSPYRPRKHGKQGLMKLGDYPGNDGPDFENKTEGFAWFWLPGGQSRRPSNYQISHIFRTMSELGYPRFEHLSASAFQTGPLHNLDDAIRHGRSERLVMNIFESSKSCLDLNSVIVPNRNQRTATGGFNANGLPPPDPNFLAVININNSCKC